MNTHFPAVPGTYSASFFNTLFTRMQQQFHRIVSHDEEAPHIILRAPNGTLYTVSVDNAGELVVTGTGKPALTKAGPGGL